MRLLPLSLAASSALAVAAAAAAASATGASDASAAAAPLPPVRINGWYRCSASTLYANADTSTYRSDDYFMETTDSDNVDASVPIKSLNRNPRGKQPAVGRAPRDADKPLGLRRRDSPGEAAMLGDPLEFARSHSTWRARQGTSSKRTADTGPHHREHGHGYSHSAGTKPKQFFEDSNDNEFAGPRYECAEFRVPYCYEGICESNRTLDVFVKRVLAKQNASHESGHGRGKALWVLQGGPGASSTAMEDLMEAMYDELEGSVSLYTMDHRGTARSNRLECQAAEAQTPGSPGGTYVVLEEMPNCIDDILFKTDNLTAAFSVTSAAMDLRTIIDHSQADEDVYVYGLSYGTYLVERLIHVPPASVRGFVIDGIVSEAGASVEERSTYSNWDHDVGVVGARFLSYCEADAYCKSKFANVTDLTQFTKDLYVELDEAARHPGKNLCADALQSAGSKRPSYFLRSAFGELLMDEDTRVLIPGIIYRAARCTKQDVEALQYFVDVWTQPGSSETDLDDVLFTSQMLYSVIVFSEMWEFPSPGIDTLVQWYEDSVMGSNNYVNFPAYCLFTGSREAACKELKHLPAAHPMRYERDEFWNSTAKLPPNTTALLLSGGLDLQTRRMYGNLQYDLLSGGDRMLVQFDYAGHCTTFTTPTQSGGPTCGVQILASYVRHDGDVARVDTSCVGDVYGLDFHVRRDTSQDYLGVEDLYAV